MPSRISVVALASVAVLGLAGCEKQSPYVTITAGGVVVKARAARYCRDKECRETKDRPTITVSNGDTIGIDVPRSVAEQGWTIGEPDPRNPVIHDHYYVFPIPQGAGSGRLDIYRDPSHGAGLWQFNVIVK